MTNQIRTNRSSMFKLFYLKLIVLAFALGSFCKANPTLLVDQDFNVISVNGSSYQGGFLTSDSKLQLQSGVNKIAVEYEVVFDQDDEFDLIKSDTLVISFYATKNNHYVLNYLKPANSRAARLFAKNPMINILDHSGSHLKASSYFLGSKSEGFINQQTRPSLIGQKPIRITSEKSIDSTDSQLKSTPSKTNKAVTNAEQQLEYWWQRATPKQRQSFLKKVLNNE